MARPRTLWASRWLIAVTRAAGGRLTWTLPGPAEWVSSITDLPLEVWVRSVVRQSPEKSGRVSCDECEDERARREHAAPAPWPDRTTTSAGRGTESERTAPGDPLTDHPR